VTRTNGDVLPTVLMPFLAQREPEVYRRYHHWWDKLPDVKTRLLPG
jgi:hypothetical protein